MKRDEIVTALRCCASFNGEFECSKDCPFFSTSDELGDCCTKKNVADADLIENQQRHIEALLQANAGLRDTILRRDAQIEKLAADRKALINELCQYCGKYKQAHEGACDGCRRKQ